MILRSLQRRALLRGVLGGSGLWTTAWVLLVGIRILRRLRSPRPVVLFSRQLLPGEGIAIRGVAPEPVVPCWRGKRRQNRKH